MKNNKKIGWISIEYILITAVIVVVVAAMYTKFFNPATEKISNAAVDSLVGNFNANETGGYTGIPDDETETSPKPYDPTDGGYEAEPATSFVYTINDNETVTITEYTGSNTEIIIPDKINGLLVTAIGDGAFYMDSLTSVRLPKYLKTIGNSAFADNSLTEIYIPSSVEFIDDYAFAFNKIHTVSLGKNVKEIGDNVFYYNKIETIDLKNTEIVGAYAFQNNQLSMLYINEATTTIGEGAFVDQSGKKIKQVNILGEETRFNDRWESIFDEGFKTSKP